MRRFVLPMAIAVAALGFASSQASATPTASSCPNAFSVCIDWTLTNTSGNTWTLLTTFTGSAGGGKLFSTGLTGSAGTDYGISGVSVVGNSNWSSGCTDLSDFSMLSACANSNNGSTATIAPGGSVTITFTATNLANNLGTLDYAAHIGGYGTTSCSIKLDKTASGVLTVVAGTDCSAPSTTTPEPVSLALLGTGLIGLGFFRRRRKGEVVDE